MMARKRSASGSLVHLVGTYHVKECPPGQEVSSCLNTRRRCRMRCFRISYSMCTLPSTIRNLQELTLVSFGGYLAETRVLFRPTFLSSASLFSVGGLPVAGVLVLEYPADLFCGHLQVPRIYCREYGSNYRWMDSGEADSHPTPPLASD